MMMGSFPRYQLPLSVLLELAGGVLLGYHLPFRRHALRMACSVRPPARVLGAEHIPQAGPGLITVNHYYRPGFWMPWLPAQLSAAVPNEIHWTMAAALNLPGHWYGPAFRLGSRWVLGGVARVYGFNSMPAMPPAPDEVTQRAAAVQRLVNYARKTARPLLGLAPEGGDRPDGLLGWPPEGFGRLALALARCGLPFYPVGAYEEDGVFTLRFGPPYPLAVPEPTTRAALDCAASRVVMTAIAACLPERLRGEFA